MVSFLESLKTCESFALLSISSLAYKEAVQKVQVFEKEIIDTLSLDPGEVFVAGDWHGDFVWAEHVLTHVRPKHIKVVVQLGDLGVGSSSEFLSALSNLAEKEGFVLLFVDGNHENFVELEKYPFVGSVRLVRPHVYHLPRGLRWVWNTKAYLALGGAVSVDASIRTPYVSWWPQEEIREDEVERIVNEGPVDVMFTHDCPASVVHDFPSPPSFWSSWDLDRSYLHRVRLQKVVDRVSPRMLMHGHLHFSYVRFVPRVKEQSLLVAGLAANNNPANTFVFSTSSPQLFT